MIADQPRSTIRPTLSDKTHMATELQPILKLRVPVIVRLGHRTMPLDDVLALGPGAIIELPKNAEKPLDLMVNNKAIGHGEAVKVGENFGLRVLRIGDPEQRIQAMSANHTDVERSRDSRND